jgi:hypothetical protein
MARGYGSPEGGHGEGDMGRALAALSPSIRDSMVVSTKVTPGQIDREAGGPRPVAQVSRISGYTVYIDLYRLVSSNYHAQCMLFVRDHTYAGQPGSN